jgi:hypothetical protein
MTPGENGPAVHRDRVPGEHGPAEAVLAEPMPFRILLDEAWKQAKRHFRVLYWPIAVPLALVQVAVVVVNAEATRNVVNRLEDDPMAVLGIYLLLLPILLLSMLIFSLVYGVMGTCATDAAAGREPRIKDALRFTLRPRMLFSLWGAGVFTLLGLMCCILPGLYLALIWGFLVPVMAEEGLFLSAAFGRSRALARYNPQRQLASSPMLKIFVLLIVGYMLSTAVSMVVQGPFIIAQQIVMFRELAAGGDPTVAMTDARLQLLQVPGAFLGSLAQTAVMLYLSFGISLLYFDVRRRSEAFDLEAAIDAAEAARPAGDAR